MLGDVNKLFIFKNLLTMPGNVLPLRLKQTVSPKSPIIWIATEGEGDGIKSRLPFKIFSTLREKSIKTKKKMFARIAIRLLCIKVCYNFMFVTQFLKRRGSNAPSVISHIPKVIYERELTTKLLTNREFQGWTLCLHMFSSQYITGNKK